MNETNALAKSTYLPPPDRGEWTAMIEMANTLAKAQGFVPQHFYNKPYAILAAVLFGRDLGISATNALQHIIVIEGKATADAQLIGMLVRRAGHSIEDQTTPEQSTVTITRGDDRTKHVVTFSMQDAQRAGLLRAGSAWSKYPQAMLYARALTACARKGAQDALMGTSYTPEEMGALNGDGEVALPPSPPTGEIPTAEVSPGSLAAIAEERERHERQQAETDAFNAAGDDEIAPFIPPDIPGSPTKFEAAPSGIVVVGSVADAAVPAKRRGRPLGAKSAKPEQGAQGERSGFGSPPFPATTPAPPVSFGEESAPADPLETLRNRIFSLASRLRRYQYMEQARELPPLEQWNKEVQRTLNIYVERKFGTDVRLEDVEGPGLQAAISDLEGYIAKYESASESDIASDDAQAVEADATVVTLHKPIVRNPVSAQRREDPTHIDPRVALDRARLVADLRNRTTALLATKEGLVTLTAKDEDRLRAEADQTMERAAQGSFSKSIKELSNEQLETLVQRVKAAAR